MTALQFSVLCKCGNGMDPNEAWRASDNTTRMSWGCPGCGNEICIQMIDMFGTADPVKLNGGLV